MISDLLLWNKIGRIIVLLGEHLGVSSERALHIFYTSETCEHLHNPDTGLYLMGDLYIVNNVIKELQDKMG